MLVPVLKSFFWSLWYGIKVKGKKGAESARLKQTWANLILDLLKFDLFVEGLPPKEGPAILVGNHISFVDIPVLMSALPACVFISKDDLLKWPIIGSGAQAIGTLFVNRSKGSDRSVMRQQISDYFKTHPNFKLVVFPSGTTSLDESHAWKKGIFEIAQQSGIPIHTFKIHYQPLRSSAYIDNDQLFATAMHMASIPNKTVRLKWLKSYPKLLGDPKMIAQELQKTVRA